jgi:hypothetical protein
MAGLTFAEQTHANSDPRYIFSQRALLQGPMLQQLRTFRWETVRPRVGIR